MKKMTKMSITLYNFDTGPLIKIRRQILIKKRKKKTIYEEILKERVK